MVVLERTISITEEQARSFADAFSTVQGRSDDQRPNKRRKLENAEALDVTASGSEPNRTKLDGYLTLCRLVLNFALPETYNDPDPPLLSSAQELPVRIKSFQNLQNSEPDTSANDVDSSNTDPAYWLELTSTRLKRTVLAQRLESPTLREFDEHLQLLPVCLDTSTGVAPTVCYRAVLAWSPDANSFQLSCRFLWRDTIDIPFRLRPNAREILFRYAPHGEGAYQNDTLTPTDRSCNSQRSFLSNWSPRDFYDNVYVPMNTPEASADLGCDQVKCQPYPFQNRAVRWLLEKEGVELLPNGSVVPRQQEDPGLPDSFQEFTDSDGRRCYVSQLYKIVTTDLSNWPDPRKSFRGGILAEEMGLGKTVEMILLFCLNRRVMSEEESKTSDSALVESGATLIITPPAILEQWKQELQMHAPSLSVCVYGGLHGHKYWSTSRLVRMLANNDVVLTTYNVISRELHYTIEPLARDLRKEKRFKSRKSPLILISWWRVCLDEAQMIESGVSHAAQVARRIPRVNAWAVTGTPIRKDLNDILGLLQFLNYGPICDNPDIWKSLCRDYPAAIKALIRNLALRHNKDLIRDELKLPPQKRVVITIPFTPVEEQQYLQSFDKMCQECGVDSSGAPLQNDWDPDSQAVIEKMRYWLTVLRQSCLFAEFTSSDNLRPVLEVLDSMIDQTESQIRTEERSLLLSQIQRGQLLENALRPKEALELWSKALKRSKEIVDECRNQLQAERLKIQGNGAPSDVDTSNFDGNGEDHGDREKNSRLGTLRLRLRSALEVQHICEFFTGNAYYQIKTNPQLTEPDSEQYRKLEKAETEAYEAAKQIRREILAEVAQRVRISMKNVDEKVKAKSFAKIPRMDPKLPALGLQARRMLEQVEEFCELMNKHAAQFEEWRSVMVNLLTQSLVDEEGDADLQGDEYETSTKHQDEMYVYYEALRTLLADRQDAINGQKNLLVGNQVKLGISQAKQGNGPSPELYLKLMRTRNELKPPPGMGSLRKIISDLRGLTTSLEWQEGEGSGRAAAELMLVDDAIERVSRMSTEQNKTLSVLEKEIDLFRETMNRRLEYYRQLQEISDSVAPYDEESVGKPLNEELWESKLRHESELETKLSGLRSKRRYLLHLRDDSDGDPNSRMCVICQSPFEIGVLTVCGHKYCRECLNMWWRQHRSCPTCKRRLKSLDIQQITYKSSEVTVREENAQTKHEADRSLTNSIYTSINATMLQEIQQIHLRMSYGSKIDALARHILWLRQHDPGAKSIVFSQYKRFLHMLSMAFSKFGIGFSSADTKNGIRKFREDPTVECFLLHAKAHSSGLNLVNATHVFFCEPLINTAVELQAIARVHRIGQHRPTTVWMYLVSNTVEESIYEISVARRLEHIKKREEQLQSPITGDHDVTTMENITETAIDAANSLALQDVMPSKLLESSGQELVPKDDLWQCLFGRVPKRSTADLNGIEREVDRFLRAEAAEERRRQNLSNTERS